MKKQLRFLFVVTFIIMLLVACDVDDNHLPGAPTLGGAIAVISREEGSGARGAFEELVNVNTEVGLNDMTANAIIQNGNGVVATLVADNAAAIGYVSFTTFTDRGNDLVALDIDGVAPNAETMLSGDYTLVRPFNFVYMPDNIGIIEEAFIAFASSTNGLDILIDLGAVVDMAAAEAFDINAWNLPAGTVSFGGSTSTEATTTALMEAFMEMFPQIEITYEAVGSGAGITGAQEGIFSLGFASRTIRDTELETGLNVITYCVDGIVMVVHPANRITNLTAEQIRGIYLAEITDWSEVQ